MRISLRKTSFVAVWFVTAFITVAAIPVDRLKSHVTSLTAPAMEGRMAGTPGAAAAAKYIEGEFQALGLQVQTQEFTGDRRNVIAKLGSASRYVLIGSHYDGQGPGFPSASDNAAGIAVMLEIARELKQKRLPTSFVFVAFDGEEQGLNGSRYYSDHPPFPLGDASAIVIFDTMGRSFMDLSTWTLFVLGAEYSKELGDVVQKRSRPDMLVIGADLIGPRSDFAPFALKRIPYLFFSHATHKDYHGRGDAPERIDYSRLARDAAIIERIIEDISRLQTPPLFMTEPSYPVQEKVGLLRQFDNVLRQRRDLPEVYRLMFSDLALRVRTDGSRETLRVATTALLALATPRLSGFLLSFVLGPFYEKEGNQGIAGGIYEEAAKWAENPDSRRELEEKARALREYNKSPR